MFFAFIYSSFANIHIYNCKNITEKIDSPIFISTRKVLFKISGIRNVDIKNII